MAIQKAAPTPTDLIPYKPGVSLVEIAKGTFGYFLPGSIVGMALRALYDMTVSTGYPAFLLHMEIQMRFFGAPPVLGFGVGLIALGHWLYPDARVSGPRSFISGLVSPLGVMIVSYFRPFYGADGMVVSFLVGVVLAVVMFFAWLSPTPEEMRGDGYEADSTDEASENQELALGRLGSDHRWLS